MTSLRSGRPIVLGPVHLVVGPATSAVCYTQRGETEELFSLLPSKPRISGAYLSRRERMVQVSCCLSLSSYALSDAHRTAPRAVASVQRPRRLTLRTTHQLRTALRGSNAIMNDEDEPNGRGRFGASGSQESACVS